MADHIKLIVGLGNPGAQYEDTRHNAGALLVEALAKSFAQSLRPDKKFHGLYAKILIQGQELHLLNPTTFMNRSGLAVQAICQFYKILPAQVLVAHDELDIPGGTAKLKLGGGHGGHNGLRDIIQSFGGNKDFYRLRLGIDHPGSKEQVVGYVLGRLGKSEREQLNAVSDEVERILPEILAGDWQKAMNRLHSFKA
ncbi:MAG: aminoacyl-tRNA hydrolase [Hahellaceae bacterium]|nr:aminoacyl-tRNA hydrolase [Hahellaceae bacterium]MCP5168878.1 aminoacyl-tRNA hydrolase [Hahellaceae bacterium]